MDVTAFVSSDRTAWLRSYWKQLHEEQPFFANLAPKHANKQTELWRVRKADRELTCVAVYTLVGLDLRLLEGGEMLRAQLCRDARRWTPPQGDGSTH